MPAHSTLTAPFLVVCLSPEENIQRRTHPHYRMAP
jgi:hypothetical protein